jgi:hypothetical protein
MTGELVWQTTCYDDRREAHIVPLGDILEHYEHGNRCICGPRIDYAFNETTATKIVTHHSADGRENHEP